MKRLITAIAIAALPAVAAYADWVTVYQTNTIDSAEFVTEWSYEISSQETLPRTATLVMAQNVAGEEVKIPNILTDGSKVWTVTGIADQALMGNPGVYKITVPNSILEIGSGAFANCTALSEVELGYGIRYIGAAAFANTAIREINIPDSVLDMGGNISAGTLFTSAIKISDSSHFCYSDDGVLYNRDKTKLYACPTRAEGTISIPNTVTNIANDAFFGCHRLVYLNLPATVNTIGSGAFNVSGIWGSLSAPESTPKLVSVFYNGPVPEAEEDIYNGAPENLVSYALDESWSGMTLWRDREVKSLGDTNPPTLTYTDPYDIVWHYRIVDGEIEIYNEDAEGNPTTAVSPISTTGVPYKEREDSNVIKMALKIPDAINGFAVTKIGPHAFDSCAAVSCLGIPASIREIGDYAFKGCTAISSIGASDDVPFNVVPNTVALPSGITKLGYHPFEGLKVSTVILPFSLSEVDGNPVAGCAFVTTLAVDSACPNFSSDGNILYNKNKSTVVAVPANYDGSKLTFPDSVTKLGVEALFGCINASTIIAPTALETISPYAFAGCSGVKSLSLPASLNEIGDHAFYGCSSLVKVTYFGDAPAATEDIYEETPETLVSYISADAVGFTEGTWKNREISQDDPDPELPEPGEYTDSDGNTWTYDIKGKNAVVTKIELNSDTVTIPATLAGLSVSEIDSKVLNELSGVKAYKSESPLYKAKNGCLYSTDGSTLIRVPDTMVLPYSVTTETVSSTATVTIIPEIKTSGNPGNDGTSVTTNISDSVSSSETRFVEGDIPLSTLLDGVTAIADYAFYGCNNFEDTAETISESLGGETGFMGSSAYIRTTTRDTYQSTKYNTTIDLGSSILVGAKTFDNSGVTGSTQTTQNQASGNSAQSNAIEGNVSAETTVLEENTSYAGWVESNGKVIGTVTVKTSKKRNGVIQLTGSALLVGKRKVTVKSMDALNALGDIHLVKDLAKSKSAAEKSAFDGFKGTCWTMACETFGADPLLGGYTTLSFSVKAKGKVSVSGTAADGTKITASAQMVKDGDTFKIPVASQLYKGKRGGFAAVFEISPSGAVSVQGGSIPYTAVIGGAETVATLTPVASSKRSDALYGDILLWGIAEDGYEIAANTGWRPRYTKTNGTFKGTINLVRKSDGRVVRATVTGVVVNGMGYGTAVVKNGASWQAEVVSGN